VQVRTYFQSLYTMNDFARPNTSSR
jgi:hypothetical protein